MSIVRNYLAQASGILEVIGRDSKTLTRAAGVIARSYLRGGTIYVFGCTHSAILAEDVFYRAGAPAFWRPLWGPGMSIATTPGVLTSAVEHSEEVGKAIVDSSRMEKGDVLFLASTSGKNAAPLAVADAALQRGAELILLTSSAYAHEKGNHSQYANLVCFKDRAVLIDNHVPLGDASLEVAGCPMAPVSTIAGSFIMQLLSVLAVEKITEKGGTPPVFKSSNAPGGKEHNLRLLEKKELKEAFFLP